VARAFDTHQKSNKGTGDVRGSDVQTTILTMLAFAGTDQFKVGFYTQGVDGDFALSETAAFVRGTNAAATDLQTALRTLTGDTSLTVTGTTDEGPFTITPVLLKGHADFVTTGHSACSVQVSRGALAYDDCAETGTPGSVPTQNGIAFDQESSRGAGSTVPLGHSIVTDGTGQTRGTTLAPPTIDGALGGTGDVTITATEVSSGGTSAVVLYAIRCLDLPAASAERWVTIDSEDADGDVVISGLTAGNYVLLGFTQTALGRVSRPSSPTYFTVA
jgi:hypothetical protein